MSTYKSEAMVTMTLNKLTIIISLIFQLFIVFTPHFSHAQLSSLGPHLKIDSLNKLLETDIDDTNKALHLFQLARELVGKNKDTSILLSKESLKLSEKLNWSKGIAYSKTVLGWCYQSQGDFPLALKYFSQVLKQGEKEDNKKIISIALGNLGIVYHAEGDYSKALKHYVGSLKIDTDFGDQWGITRNTGLIGGAYFGLKNYQLALDYLFSALKMAKELNNENGVAVWQGDIGNVYKAQGEFDKALTYHLKALKLFEKLENKWSCAEELCDIGITYTLLKKYSLGAQYLHRAVALSEQIKALEYLRNSYEGLCDLYEKSNTPLPDTIKGKLMTMEQMRLRSLYYHKQFITIRDSIFGQIQIKKQLHSEFEATVEASKANQEKKDAMLRHEFQMQKIIRNSFIVGSILLIILIVVLVNRNKLKRTVEIEKMRSRLSRDLHDDIGSTLSSINILSRTAQRNAQDSDNDKIKMSLEKINERSQRLLSNMSDIIWNINPANDSTEEMISRMREYATTILEAKGINYHFDFPVSSTLKLPIESKSNLYLIFKEAINNLVKYSGCTSASLVLSFTSNKIYLCIEDNGQGFNMNLVKHHGGLINMQLRAKDMHAELSIHSEIGIGTRIELRTA